MSLLAVLLSKIDVQPFEADPCFVKILKMKLLIEFKLSMHGSDVHFAIFFSEPTENLLKIQIATTTYAASIIVQDVRPPMHGALVKSTPSTEPSRPTSAKTLTPITNTQAHTQIHIKYNEMTMKSTPSTEPPRPTSAAVLLS